MLFLKYLWQEPIFRLLIPIMVLLPFWTFFLISANIPNPWLLVPSLVIIGLAGAFVIEVLICFFCYKIYEAVWKQGYLIWKQKQELEPSYHQEELLKIKKVLERYRLEVKIKNNNPTAQKIWEEYQCVLALTDGVPIVENVMLSSNRYLDCLKDYDELL